MDDHDRIRIEGECIHNIDATPDAGYVLRILEAHLHNNTVATSTDNTAGLPPTNPLCIAMNEWAAKRAEMLRAAIATLRAKGSN